MSAPPVKLVSTDTQIDDVLRKVWSVNKVRQFLKNSFPQAKNIVAIPFA